MKITSIVPLVAIVFSSTLSAIEPGASSASLRGIPKNLARQHLGSNLFLYNTATKSYGATEAAAAWLDDDATTGWSALAGKQHYMLVLTEPELISSFSLSTRPTTGTVSLYVGDEPAVPGAKTWLPVAKDLSIDSINHKKSGKSFSRFAKYLLIETDIADPGPVYSLYLYGEKPAVSYTLRRRDQPIDARSVFGPYVNSQTNFNLAGLYAGARVSYASSPDGFGSWQKAIDDNPETILPLSASATEPGAIITLGESRMISRVSVATRGSAKGQLSIAVRKAAPAGATPGTAAAMADRAPTATLVFDGTNDRASIAIPATQGSELAVRWSPISPSDTLAVAEISAFGDLSLNDYEVGGNLPVVAAFDGAVASTDGKSFKDIVDPKAEPIAAGPASPYLAPGLGFPPPRTGRLLPPIDPESN